MNCPDCGHETTMERGDHAYRECGLPGIVLCNIPIERCGNCGLEEAQIPAITQLHRLLALEIAKASFDLSGAEIRFLRKSLGWSGADFATKMAASPETVSRWENSHERMGGRSQVLLRLYVQVGDTIDDYETAPIRPHDRRPKIRMEHANGDWGRSLGCTHLALAQQPSGPLSQ